ncbi:Adenylate and Guanylate cyclase catalytic domain containing protein [Trichomonas vaginalis G3]|uniref:Adenylate and Guanylate cyclase catalytic domain containing protein n=1 Tax=Trichomonas vaginalis (strain ATCC PRA-98 / G3) TaxID=412133 RepID=A2DFM1_TRIV3|nr:guanylate cyclase protein [Trichomonas vaginalis G3]EAY20724.1 Adenylate and Guanylate cyclase catalytic domain containing protein [Trichomonas vaginalis G3]KAI5529501.1 guanylate cyclase protein [Trichomonas vaginalis G3]|eukprot:XP_001581710.1 Adenylate and Guanylate cyclase catalytic domain containing protein [Trichomonas vaginalis G3]
MKLDQMRNHQSSLFYEDDYSVVTDASKTIPVHVSIIGMKSSSDNVNSFVLIVRNQEFLVQQQKQAEEEKRKSETLLYQILPRDIVNQINRGEKDISFQVQAVSIIFIDINKFSEYAANLTPKDIMSNLSYYFSVLDKTALKYNMLTKIKLIGDIYMAAVGLFNQDLPADEFADQAVLFSSDVLSQLEEINRKLDSNLSVRVGINSGGPIIAGVLGTDKPLFDIIGDAINVAARLQSTCATNHIHISAATHDLIKSKNYEFTDCGETELKGKGKQKTYNVSIPQLIYTATSSIVMK